MLDIKKLRKKTPGIVLIGSYPPIIQSILDFDYLLGRKKPSVITVIGGKKRFERFFWGNSEICIPHFPHISEVDNSLLKQINLFLNVTSGRRALDSTETLINQVSNLDCGVVFAEDVPEMHALSLFQKSQELKIPIIGPASVGLLVPEQIKLGAIGGIQPKQIANNTLLSSGEVAVFSASGGMVNELINILAQKNIGISFALSFGGERFPILSPKQSFLAAEKDAQTKAIVYFGEIGGADEYEVAGLVADKKITKPVIAYVAGRISEVFNKETQFGHAKALVKYKKESAKEKTNVLKKAGVKVASSFKEFVLLMQKLQATKSQKVYNIDKLEKRKKALFVTSLSVETGEEVIVLGENLLTFSQKHSFAYIVAALVLGKKNISGELEKFTDMVLRLMVDHGPLVSGVVNTSVAARAGKDLVSSLSAGLLTIGNRFGGAVNNSAKNWIMGVEEKTPPRVFVEKFASRGEYIEGIGHRKYSTNNPDKRVAEILKFSHDLKEKRFTQFAKEVEKVTTTKKANLILNPDGAMAAVLLDILSEKEKLTLKELKELVEIEFFNAYFIIPRSVGLIAHYFDQKRLDEPLPRLPKDEVTYLENPHSRRSEKILDPTS